MDGSAEIVDFQAYRDAADDDVGPAVRATTLRRIRLLRRMLDRLELRVAAADAIDIADVGTDDLVSLAGLWFPWAFDNRPPPPHFKWERRDAWREWCREVANRG